MKILGLIFKTQLVPTKTVTSIKKTEQSRLRKLFQDFSLLKNSKTVNQNVLLAKY
jgi:hypothetical protein